MRHNYLLVITAAAALLFSPARAGAQEPEARFSEAVKLYENGVYGKARTIFESLGDPMSKAYVVLCAVKADDDDHARLYREYNDSYPESVLGNRIRYEYAGKLFAKEDYAGAADLLRQVSETRLSQADQLNYNFRRAYCAFDAGRYDEALPYLLKVENAPQEQSHFARPLRVGLHCISGQAVRRRGEVVPPDRE